MFLAHCRARACVAVKGRLCGPALAPQRRPGCVRLVGRAAEPRSAREAEGSPVVGPEGTWEEDPAAEVRSLESWPRGSGATRIAARGAAGGEARADAGARWRSVCTRVRTASRTDSSASSALRRACPAAHPVARAQEQRRAGGQGRGPPQARHEARCPGAASAAEGVTPKQTTHDSTGRPPLPPPLCVYGVHTPFLPSTATRQVGATCGGGGPYPRRRAWRAADACPRACLTPPLPLPPAGPLHSTPAQQRRRPS